MHTIFAPRVNTKPEQLAVLRSFAGWASLRRSGQREAKAAICALQITSKQDLIDIPEEELMRRLGSSIHRRYVRLGVRYLMIQVGRPWKWINGDSLAVKKEPELKPEQDDLVRKLAPGPITAGKRLYLRNGVLLLDAHNESDLKNISTQRVCELIRNQSSRLAAYSIRLVLRLVGRKETFSCNARQTVTSPKGMVWVSKREQQWLDQHPASREAFVTLKDSFTRYLVEHNGNSDRFQYYMPAAAMQVFCHLPPHLHSTLKEATEGDWLQAITKATLVSITHANSLASQHRRSRSRKDLASEPGYETSRSLTATLRILHRFLGLPETVTPSHNAVWRNVKQQRSMKELHQVAVHDALSVEEMQRVLIAANTKQEQVIILLLSRLGMRIGAIRQLRLSGILDGVAPTVPWRVRRFINGVDKNGQTNTWDTDFDPLVRNSLQSYIDEDWRPQWERWLDVPNRDQKRLENLWVFPSKRRTASNADQPMSSTCMNKIVKGLLERAGIRGPHAHPHSFRKGVVTALLKSGNALHFVSRFVHHKSTQVTEMSYDKMTYEEVVEKMLIPIQWERREQPTPCESDNDETNSTRGTSGSVSAANLQAATALLDEMNKNDELRRHIDILMGMLPPEQLQKYQELTSRMDATQ